MRPVTIKGKVHDLDAFPRPPIHEPKPKKKSKRADADEKPVADEAVAEAEATEATE